MAEWIKAATTSQVKAGKPLGVTVKGQRLALFSVAGKYYAIAAVCTHSGGPLDEGMLSGKVLQCPWHGSKFDVTTGKVVGPPATKPVSSYKVQVRGSDVLVEI